MKVIKEFPNYKIDKDGTVTTKDGRILTHSKDNMGYLTVSLRKDGKSYTKRVHRLVGEAYLKPVKGKNIINHIDGNKNNPHIDNLEYMSNSENTKHGYDNNLYKSKSMLPIIVTNLNGDYIGDYRSIRAVSNQFGVNRKTLSSILNGDRKNSYEYNFKYKEDKQEKNNMDKIANYKEMIYKEASDNKSDKQKNKVKNTTKSALMGVSGVGLIHLSKDRVLGQKTLYHGTSDTAWNSIKNEGLKTDKGGKGGASLGQSASESYKKNNEGFVYVTGVKKKANNYKRRAVYNETVDKMWRERNEDIIKGRPYKDIEYNKIYKETKNKGKNLKIKMNYDKYKDHFEIAPLEAGREYIGKGKVKELYGKHLAAKGNVDIGKDEIVGLHKTSKRLKNQLKYLPKYIKNNKVRFGTGVALAGTGTALVGKAIKNVKKDI